LLAEAELALDDGMTQRTFGGVVGRLDAFDFEERPELFAVSPEFAANLSVPRTAFLRQVVASGVMPSRGGDYGEAATRCGA
jgi:hypothetical protein